MVRTFLVALRASTAIAVQICANLLSVGLSCVRALEKLPKRDTVCEDAAKIVLKSCESLEQHSGLLSPFCRQKCGASVL